MMRGGPYTALAILMFALSALAYPLSAQQKLQPTAQPTATSPTQSTVKKQTKKPGKEKVITHADILKNFEIIAFGSEYSGRKYQYVRKWTKPIYVGLQGKTTPEFEQIFSQIMHRLRKLTKHTIELRYSYGMKKAGSLPPGFDPKKSGINVLFFFYPRKELPERTKRYFKNSPEQLRTLYKQGATCVARVNATPQKEPKKDRRDQLGGHHGSLRASNELSKGLRARRIHSNTWTSQRHVGRLPYQLQG
ncbi:MAG: DUF2927 domain-containing protein [Proteobacteria bacterium]|nr:DUF2927 domain-containing protein [Pseudomonadota bacterium]